MKAQEVPVEIRLWATRPENHLIRIPVAEEGVIVADHQESEDNAPMLLVDGQAYAPWTEDAFAAILLVPTEPTNEEAELLRAATEAGYCIEPISLAQATASSPTTATRASRKVCASRGVPFHQEGPAPAGLSLA
jgi:hypothetical protein